MTVAYVCVYKVPLYNFQVKPIMPNKMVRHLPLVIFNQSLVEIMMKILNFEHETTSHSNHSF
jgi:hypothetical protein